MGRSIFNLIKNVVGAGILAIPGGVTAFSQSKAAILPTVGMIVGLGSMSGYCFRSGLGVLARRLIVTFLWIFRRRFGGRVLGG